MRLRRAITSSTVSWSMWPMCSDPVTFGGGMTMTNAGLSDFASARKYPFDSHHWYQRLSTSRALYVLGSSAFIHPLQFLANNLLRDIGHDVPGNAFDNVARHPLNHAIGNAIDVFVRHHARRAGHRLILEDHFEAEQILFVRFRYCCTGGSCGAGCGDGNSNGRRLPRFVLQFL